MIKKVLYGIGAAVLLSVLVFGVYSLVDNYSGSPLALAQGRGNGQAVGGGYGYNNGVCDGTCPMYDGQLGPRFNQQGYGYNNGVCDGTCPMYDGQTGPRFSQQNQNWNQGRSQGQGMMQRPGMLNDSGRGQSFNQTPGQGRGLQDGSRIPNPQVEVGEWLSFNGTINSLDINSMTITTDDGQQIVLQLGPEWFWTSQGVTLSEGQAVSVQAFEDDGLTTAGQVTVVSSGQTLQLRDEDGRPLWAGQAF